MARKKSKKTKKLSHRKEKRNKMKPIQMGFYDLFEYLIRIVVIGITAFISWALLSFIFGIFSYDSYSANYNSQALAALVFVLTVIAILALTIYTFFKPYRYIQAVVDGAARLSDPDEDHIELPEDLAQVEIDLNRTREDLLYAQRAAREAEKRKNDLVVYLAHDLKTPLTSVIGYLTLLEEEPDLSPQMRARFTNIALDKADRLEDLINEFFEITRFNLTELSLDLETINISRMVEQMAYEFQPILDEKGLTWQLHLEAQVNLLCDPAKMERVLDNLFKNAYNYSYLEAPIRVDLMANEDQVFIRVQNQGRTIPPDKLDRLFDQFFRLDSARGTGTGGAGLGLAISKEIIEAHGGAITCESANEIIRFSLVLPRK